ncbi:MAG: hypothetical protein PF636_11365 [Actinomycetota bacterium]|jgi:hypothetical protein|nr:hypothetical protein [Actinomycetota bacterium]
MKPTNRTLVLLFLGIALTILVTGCAAGEADDPTGTGSSPGASDQTADDELAAGLDTPLPEEQRYRDVLAAGLDFSFALTPDDGEFEVVQNMEGYGSVRWGDAEGREVLVVRRYVADEPEEWTYQDEGSRSDGVVPDEPSITQLDAWDGLAETILVAVGVDAEEYSLTRSYAWTDAASGIGSAAYSLEGTTDDPQLNMNLGVEGRLSRLDLTLPLP